MLFMPQDGAETDCAVQELYLCHPSGLVKTIEYQMETCLTFAHDRLLRYTRHRRKRGLAL